MKDETFFAWLDGELDETEAARVGAEVEADPALSARAAQHRRMQARLKEAFDPVLTAPVPDPLLARLQPSGSADVIDFTMAKKRREHRAWTPIVQWGSIAATLVLGILVGTAIPHRTAGGPLEVKGSKLYAAASLSHGLDTALASAPAGDVRIGLTFRDRAGAICRTFTGSGSSGLACRDQDRWLVRGLFSTPKTTSTDYRMAAGPDPALAALVDSSLSGEPFDAAEERAARARRWH